MGGEDHALRFEIHGTSEADSTTGKAEIRPPLGHDLCNLFEHPVAATRGTGGARFATDHHTALDDRKGEFRAADIDSENRSGGGHVTGYHGGDRKSVV